MLVKTLNIMDTNINGFTVYEYHLTCAWLALSREGWRDDSADNVLWRTLRASEECPAIQRLGSREEANTRSSRLNEVVS